MISRGVREARAWMGRKSYRARLERLGIESIREIARENGKRRRTAAEERKSRLKARRTVSALWLVALLLQAGMCGAQTQETWHGFVTDTHCGTNCQVTKDMTPDKKCIQRCVGKGSKYGLWVEHHVYELEPQSEAAPYAAKDVSVTGTLDGETIHIHSITPSKPSAGHT